MSNKNERSIFEVDKIEISNYAEIEKKDLKGVLKCKNKVEEFLEHKYKIVILCLVAIIVVEFLLINNKSKLLRMIFLTKDNEFQWLAGTAIAAMLTFLFTSINTIKKNKADLVARARIEWINDVRGILAIYLSDINNSTLYYSQLNRKYSKLTDTQAKNKLSLETKGQEDVTRLKKK
ncbi:hypothetical protein [Carnobacterium maltaromaticum]|uniref:hypothetical protein n=1 Tax=Carnobacterium maltaromaticum TaxID=2751 RepID=UPI00165A4E0E|nr:hypothetical protein [Carnobacterium maltaromaticum]MBC9788611.1 hypothetical protein [Carnobacterium maltaromaticum]